MAITSQAKFLVRTFAKDISVKRMECEKADSFDDDCQLNGCVVCKVDEETDFLYRLTKSIRQPNREYDDLEEATKQFESCCSEGRKEPLILISNDKWIKSVTIITLELLRKALENFGVSSQWDTANLDKMIGLAEYAIETVVKKCSTQARFNFEVLDDTDEDSLELI